MVNQLNETDENGVEIRGMMLSTEVGLYAARIVALKNLKKDIKVMGPAMIEFDKASQNFVIVMDGPLQDVFIRVQILLANQT